MWPPARLGRLPCTYLILEIDDHSQAALTDWLAGPGQPILVTEVLCMYKAYQQGVMHQGLLGSIMLHVCPCTACSCCIPEVHQRHWA